MAELTLLEKFERFLQIQCETSMFSIFWQITYHALIYCVWGWKRLTHPSGQILSEVKKVWPNTFPRLTIIKELQLMGLIEEYQPKLDQISLGLGPLDLPFVVFTRHGEQIVQISVCRCCPFLGVIDLKEKKDKDE